MAKGTCKIDSSHKVVDLRKGMCDGCYRAWRKYGDPLHREVIQGDDEARFLAKVDRRGDDECWPWKGHHDRDGYAVFSVKHINVGAHRWAYEHFVEPIPEGLHIDHVKANGCTRRDCTNYVRHLEPVTPGENTLRGDGPSGQNSRKEFCDRQHEFTPENTYVYADGRRSCRECMRMHNRQWVREKRARARARRAAGESGLPAAVTEADPLGGAGECPDQLLDGRYPQRKDRGEPAPLADLRGAGTSGRTGRDREDEHDGGPERVRPAAGPGTLW